MSLVQIHDHDLDKLLLAAEQMEYAHPFEDWTPEFKQEVREIMAEFEPLVRGS